MPKKAVMTLQVNGFGIDWTSDPKRKSKPCTECGKPTDGRADTTDVNGRVTHGTKPICMDCSIGTTFKRAFAGAKAVTGGGDA